MRPNRDACSCSFAGGFFVFAEIGFESERLSTFLARKGFAVGVGLNVGTKVRLVSKGLVAQLAFEGTLT
jgi:hypothetical protein